MCPDERYRAKAKHTEANWYMPFWISFEFWVYSYVNLSYLNVSLMFWYENLLDGGVVFHGSSVRVVLTMTLMQCNYNICED